MFQYHCLNPIAEKGLSLFGEEYKNTDDTTWELKIKDGIKFSNGKQVTAKEVKASLDRILDKKEISAGKALSVDSIDADGQKLTIKT